MKYVYHVKPCRVAKLVTKNVFEEDRLQQVAGDYGVSTELVKEFILDVAKKLVTREYAPNDTSGMQLLQMFESKYQVMSAGSAAIPIIFFSRLRELIQVHLIFGYNEDNIQPNAVKVAFTKNNRLEVSLRYPKPEEDHEFPELESMDMYDSDLEYPVDDEGSGDDNGEDPIPTE